MAGWFKRKNKGAEASPPGTEGGVSVLPDDKKSRAEISEKRANLVLVGVAFAMLAVFVVGANIVSEKRGAREELEDMASAAAEASAESGPSAADKIEQMRTWTYVAPVVGSNPASVSIPDAVVGEDVFRQVVLSVSNAPVRVLSVAPSMSVAGFGIEGDCVDKDAITPETGCVLNVFWSPVKKENRSLFINVEYGDPDSVEPAANADSRGKARTFRIPVGLQSSEAPSSAVVDDDGEEPGDDLFADEMEEVPPSSAKSAPPPAAKRTIYPDDCKKYASKAYDFSGVFLGWVQGGGDVFSPNCSKVLGVMEDDGIVIEAGTGRVIGKGAVLDKKKSEEKRIELQLPVLSEVAAEQAANDFSPDPESVASNRQLVKSGALPLARVQDENYDLYKAIDPLGVFRGQRNSLIPFTITETSQISSMPKDERYVLRQGKPIPAVLVRPIYFSGMGGELDQSTDLAIAVVERNVYGGDGRTIVIPSGSQLIGTAVDPASDGLQRIQKISITWQRLIRPDGAEFDLSALSGTSTGDAQGRAGVPGKNDTEYMRDLVINPLLYSVLPVAMEAIFPTTSNLVTRVRRSDGRYQVLDNGELTTGGEAGDYSYNLADTENMLNMTSKDKMKLEIQQNWKSVANRLLEESMSQKVPFTVPAGTRINVFLNQDVMLRIDEEMNEMIQEGTGGANEYRYGG